jgi:hypothetical protein
MTTKKTTECPHCFGDHDGCTAATPRCSAATQRIAERATWHYTEAESTTGSLHQRHQRARSQLLAVVARETNDDAKRHAYRLGARAALHEIPELRCTEHDENVDFCERGCEHYEEQVAGPNLEDAIENLSPDLRALAAGARSACRARRPRWSPYSQRASVAAFLAGCLRREPHNDFLRQHSRVVIEQNRKRIDELVAKATQWLHSLVLQQGGAL